MTDAATRLADVNEGIARAAKAARRSPDEVRALLSRYRSGLEAGRQTDDPSQEVEP